MKSKVSLKCICSTNEHSFGNEELQLCLNCHSYQHKECIKAFIKMDKYICPQCQFKYSDMCIKQCENLLPLKLIANQSSIIHKMDFTINLDIDRLKAAKDFNVYSSFIILHCLQITEQGFTFKWPLNCVIKVNNKQLLDVPGEITKNHLELQPVVFTFCANIEKKAAELGYTHFPYNQPIHRVSEYILKLKETQIEIAVLGGTKHPAMDYIVSIDCIRVLSEKEVISSISVLKNKLKIQSLIRKDSDMFFMSAKEEVNLLDIYTGVNRIELPSRGLNCNHLGVFDLRNFIVLNRKNRKYKCPICRKNTRLVYVDGFIMEISKKHLNREKVLIDIEYNVYPVENTQIGNKMNKDCEAKAPFKPKAIGEVKGGWKEATTQQEAYEKKEKEQKPQDKIQDSPLLPKKGLLRENCYDVKDMEKPQTDDKADEKLPSHKRQSLARMIMEKKNRRINEKLKEFIKPEDFVHYDILKFIFSDGYYDQ